MALKFGPNSARNRNTSLIRRISALGLGTIATPPKKGGTVVAITSMSAAVPSASGLANSPASGGGFDRPQVAIIIGLEWRLPPARAAGPRDSVQERGPRGPYRISGKGRDRGP